MAEKDFESAVKGVLVEENNRTALNQSLALGSEYDPDEYAKKYALAAKTGVATRVVYDFPEEAGKAGKAREIQVGIEDILKTAPKTSTYLASSVDNAAISQDDIGILAKIEQAFQTPVDIARSAVSNIMTTAGGQIAGAAKADEIGDRMSKIGLSDRFSGAYEVMKFIAKPTSFVGAASPVTREDVKQAGETLKQAGRDIDVPIERKTFITDVSGGISQMIVQSLTSPLTGGASLFYQGVDIMSDKVAKDNASQLAKDLTIVGAAGFTSMLEKVGLDKVMSRMPKQAQTQLKAFLVDKLKAFGIEFTTELAENIVQDTARKLGTNPDAAIGEGAVYESTVAGTAALIVRTALGVKSYRQAKQQQQMIEDLANPIGQSTTRQRSPEKFQEFINELTKDGPVQNIFIPQEQFAQYYQSQNRNPEDVAAQLGIKNYGEAELSGGDLVVPMNTFATQIAPTTDLQGLMPDIRYRQGWSTARENQELQDAANEDAKRLAKQFETEDVVREADREAFAKIKSDIEGQLTQLGLSRLEADMNAEVAARWFKGVGYRAFKNIPKADIESFINRKFAETQFKVSMPRASVLQDKKVDMQLDPLLDSLRSRMSFDEKKIYGPSLIEFLKMKKIKLDDSMGELAARDIDIGRKAFERKLIAEKGDEKAFGLEKAAEIAHSWGFIPETNEQLFLEALDEDLRGNPVYSSELTDAKLEDYVNKLDQLQQYLDQYNIDLNELTNEQVREKLAQIAEEPQAEPDYFQFAGERAVNADIYALSTAKERLKKGDSAEIVRRQTGWFQGVDGKWRYEISDEEAEFIDPPIYESWENFFSEREKEKYGDRFSPSSLSKKDFENYLEFRRNTEDEYNRRNGPRKLITLLKHPKLFAAYPDLAKLPVEFERNAAHNGVYYPQFDQIGITFQKDIGDMLSTLLHEVQHAIQHREGFATGGMPQGDFTAAVKGALNKLDLRSKEEVELWKWRNKYKIESYEQAAEVARYGYMYESAQRLLNYSKHDKPSSLFRLIRNEIQWIHSPEFRGTDESRQLQGDFYMIPKRHKMRERNLFIEDMAFRASNMLMKAIPQEYVDQFKSDNRTMRSMLESLRRSVDKKRQDLKPLFDLEKEARSAEYISEAHKYSTPFEVYQALAGEVEARNTQARQALTEEERVEKPPYMTADVPREKVIVMFGSLDIQAPLASFSEGAEDADISAEVANTYYQKVNENIEVNRGFVTFGKGKNKTVDITLLKDRDFSTFIHELGHVGLELFLDVAEEQNVSEEFKQDAQLILDFLGVKDRSEIKTVHHEKFARAHEMYFLEGKAPSIELRSLFQRFKQWFSWVYKKLSDLNVELSDDIRAVFDRVYATDEEIELARTETELNPLFTNAEDIGMTQDEFNAYQNSVNDEIERAKEKLTAKLLKEHYERNKLWYREKLDEEQAKVAEEVKGMRVYIAFNRLKDPSDEIRLSKQDLIDRYGAEFIKRLPRPYVYAKTGGMRVDDAAELLGYESGETMIKELVEMKPMREYIKEEAKQRVLEQYGDIQTDGTFIDEARAALHNEARADVLAIEMRALRRKQREVAPFVRAEKKKATEAKKQALSATKLPTMAQFRAMARGMIDAKQVRDITPYEYLMAERKHNREAFKAMAKGDYNAAFISKQKEMINHFMYLEGTKARDRIEKIRDYAASFDKKAKREKIAKAGKQFLEQIDTILENYEFKRVTGVQIEQRQKLLDFVAEQEKAGNYVNVTPEMIDEANAKNYKQATYAEMVAIEEAIKSIEHIARNENKIMVGELARDFENFKSELLTTVRDSKELRKDVDAFTAKPSRLKDKVAKTWRNWDASHLKVEQLFEWFDGGVKDGPWGKVFDIAAQAQTKEYDLHAKVTTALADLQENMPENWKKSLLDNFDVDLPNGAGQRTISKMQLIGIALNTGNDGNYARLKNGRGQGFEWSNEQIVNALKNLKKEDWDFVQGVWDTVNLLWDDIVALEERMTGIAPPKVEAKEQTILNNYGETITVKGGYFPIVYDRRYSFVGEKQAETKETLQDFISAQYSRATTSKGHTETRVENYNAPLDFDWADTLSYHMSSVIKDISHREAVKSLLKILKNTEVKGEIENRFGKEYVDMLNDWVVTLVMDRTDSMRSGKVWANTLLKTRTNMAIVTMGFKATTVLSQVAGFGPSFDFVSRRNFGNALIEFSSNPKAAFEFVTEKSGEMRFRTSTLDRDVKDGLRLEKGQDGIVAAVRRTAFYATGYMDMAVSIPTWIGAYKQALIEGSTEADAITYADKAVRLSQGAAGGKDMAAIVANKGLMSLFTMYYTPFSALYSRLRDVGYQTNSMKDLPKQSARLIGLVIFPALMGALLSGQGPDEDEDKVWWAIRKTLLYPMTALIGLKDLTGMTEKWMIGVANEGKMDYKPSYNLSPVEGAIRKIVGIPDQLAKLATGKKDFDDVAWELFETSGYIFGLPTAQVRITGEYLQRLLNGEENPNNAADILKGLLFRPKKD